MKKIFAILLVVSLIMMTVVACGKGDKIDKEFKATMDEYEDFVDEYVTFMEKYKENPTDMSLLEDANEFMSSYESMMEKIEELGEKDLNEAEREYYQEVTERVAEKLAKVAD